MFGSLGDLMIILGAGGHARSIGDLLVACKTEAQIFLDMQQSSSWEYITKIGKKNRPTEFALGIGGSSRRKRIYEFVREILPSSHFPPLIHPTAYLSTTASVGDAAQVMAMCFVGPGATLGTGVLANTSSSIDHDSKVGAFSALGPGSRLAGYVEIDESVEIGMGAILFDRIKVGENTIIGGGSTVVRDLPSNVVAFGSPCRIRKVGKSRITTD